MFTMFPVPLLLGRITLWLKYPIAIGQAPFCYVSSSVCQYADDECVVLKNATNDREAVCRDGPGWLKERCIRSYPDRPHRRGKFWWKMVWSDVTTGRIQHRPCMTSEPINCCYGWWVGGSKESCTTVDARSHSHHMANAVEQLCGGYPRMAMRPISKLLWAVLLA